MKLSTKNISLLLLLTVSVAPLVAQPYKNQETFTCQSYSFRSKKFKIRLSDETSKFKLKEVILDFSEPIKTNTVNIDCPEALPITFEEGDMASHIYASLLSEFPSNARGYGLKIKISDLTFRKNLLPTPNPRAYAKFEFFVESTFGNYDLKYASTYFVLIQPNRYIEGALGRLISGAVKDFLKNSRYENELILLDSSKTEDIVGYTSFEDIINNNPTYAVMDRVDVDTAYSNVLVKKYILRDDGGKKVKSSYFAIRQNDDLLLNVAQYYPKAYYSKMEALNDDFYIMFDRVYDYTQASKTTALTGGGLLGAVIGASAATRDIPVLINKHSGEIRAFSDKSMKKILEGYATTYKDYKAISDDDSLTEEKHLFKKLIEDDRIK